VTFYGDFVKKCEDFVPNFGDKKNWLLHHDNAPSHTSFFTREYLTKNNMTVVSQPPYTLTDHDFQDAFKNGRRAGNGANVWNGITCRVMVANTSTLSF
jgi:hypothetical protein